MDLQPRLEGPTLSVRPLAADDRGALWEVARQPGLWEQHPARERGTRAGFDAFFDESLASGGCLVVVERATGEVVGSSRYHDYRAGERSVEIGWTYLHPRCWGGAVNAELKQLMLAHAASWVHRVLFVVAPGNLRSQRAMEKVGGARVGTRLREGGREDLVYEIRVGVRQGG